MLDLKFVAENRERVTELLLSRGQALRSGEGDLWARDAERRALIVKVETLRHQQRVCGEEIARRGKAKEDASALKTEMKGVADEIKALEVLLEQAESALRALLLTLPNLPDASVPKGRDAAANVEVRRVGSIPSFDFPPKAHWDLGVELGILDFERAAKISGARFSVSWDDGARLERALVDFMLDVHASRGYREVLPPYLVTADTLTGTGQLPKFEGDLFKTRAASATSTSSHRGGAVTNLHREEILDGDAAAEVRGLQPVLPLGGRLLRQGRARAHPPAPVPQGRAREAHDARDVDAELESMVADAEEVLKRSARLSGDAPVHGRHGLRAAKTYDIEVWLPGQDATARSRRARTAAISRRGGRACATGPRAKGKPRFVHT
jgi:seryl-tRNA synthetase